MRYDPWNLSLVSGSTRVVGPTTFVGGVDPAPVIARSDPERLFLLIVAQPNAGDFGVSLEPIGLGGGIKPASGQNYILIHTAELPGLTQQQWYGYSMLGIDLIVYDVSQMRK